jgi:DNA-binding NtrC family response regulator
MKSTHTVLYITDDLSTVDLTAWKLDGTGLEFVSTNTSDAVALLFVNRRVEAVVLDKRREPHAAIDLARVLKSFRDIPLILVSANSIDSLPKCVDACVCIDDVVGEMPRLIEAMLKLPDSALGRSNDPFAKNSCACLQEQQPFPEKDSRH